MTAADTENGKNDGTEKSEEGNDINARIIKQIEFYFGDSNLPRDKFMLEQVKLDEGWIPMSTMIKFQRLAKLTSDTDVIVNALKQSQLMEVDTTGDEPKMRRAPSNPLPEMNAERRKNILERTVYVKGFPLESDLDPVLKILDPYGPPDNVFMRRYKDKITQKFLFKGSVFVTFPTKEKAEEFLKIPSIKCGDVELIRMWQADYYEKKRNEVEDGKKNKNKESKQQSGKKDADLGKTLKKGATIHLTGEFAEETTREDLKEVFTNLGADPTSYIGFNKGDKEAYLRLPNENSAAESVEKWGKEVTVRDVKLSLRVLEGEEEETYLKRALEEKKAHIDRIQKNKKSRGFGKKRRGQNSGGPPSKKRSRD